MVNFPCNSCYVPKEHLNKLNKSWEPRKSEKIQDLITSNEDTDLHVYHSAHPIQVSFIIFSVLRGFIGIYKGN